VKHRAFVVGFLAIAVVIALSVVVGCSKKAPAPVAANAATAPQAPASTTASGPEMATCPVTGITKPKSEMIPVEYKGKTYYLCCSDCKPKFEADPEKYIGAKAAPGGTPKAPMPEAAERSH
jgi:YHS domain-containing protein